MRRRYGYYWTWIVGLVTSFVGLVAAMVWLGRAVPAGTGRGARRAW